MDRINKTAIIGMGALGVLYGDIITGKLGTDAVSFVADRERIDRYKSCRVSVNGRICDFNYEYADNSHIKPDLAIVAVKSTALDAAIEELGKTAGDDTVIISVLNGISSEEIIRSRLGSEHIIHCVAQGMDAVKLGNKLTYSRTGELRLGIPKQLQTKEKLLDLHMLCDFLDRIGVSYKVEDDILRRMWGKWMLNVGVNQVVMVYEGTYATIQKPGEPRDMMIKAMREVAELAKAENIAIGEEDISEYLKLMDTLSPEGMPSMRQDGLLGRKTEVEQFAGTVIKKADTDKVEVPVNRELYRRVRELEQKYGD